MRGRVRRDEASRTNCHREDDSEPGLSVLAGDTVEGEKDG